MSPWADIHSHLVPGVDDGARDLEEAMLAVDRLAAEGIHHILTTPHLEASTIARSAAFERNRDAVETGWRAVVEQCRERHPGITLLLGREIMLDAPFPDLSDPHVRLAGGHYVLVEFPLLGIPPGSSDAMWRIRDQGFRPIVAHVERYGFESGEEYPILERWRDAGALFQVNAPSLMGKYGSTARDLAWELLRGGWVDLMASDYHARGRTWITEARASLLERGGGEQIALLMEVNPQRVLADQPLEVVPPLLAAESAWRRVLNAFGRRRGVRR